MVLEKGFEPLRLAATDFKSVAYATSATQVWYSWWDLNPHTLRHWSLNPACLPIPPQLHGCPDGTWTHDLWFIRPLLSPTELQDKI